MEKQILIMGIIEDLLAMTNEKYQEAKDYWKEHPPKGENLIEFVRALFEYTDMKRTGGKE